ncbi:hypothetical protein L218DRAFT_1080306 [Marasmius fiardii PR-910]|nr:hypothetical protein L218DRAFT_1080306 [Marasmius fiardii PR-910]
MNIEEGPINIVKHFEALEPNTNASRVEIAIDVGAFAKQTSGVGSEADFAGEQITGTGPMQAFGTAVASKIRDAYVFIAQNFEKGDEICIFGFSRGAYTARKLSGLIDAIGLLSRQNLSYFFEIWSQLVNKPAQKFPDTQFPEIKCVGVFDTVGSVLNTIDALNIKDTSLPAKVKVALHAVSLQENRDMFLPTLWTIPTGGLKAGQVLKQVWFPGAHSDVGGGYERHELSDISVFWMAGEIQNLINLDLEFLRSYGQPKPQPWGTSQPHNAYKEQSIWEGIVIWPKTRLESGDITKQSSFHESIKYSPQTLDSPSNMITRTMIEKQFGSPLQYVALNAFEKECKDKWGVVKGPVMFHGIESPLILMPPVSLKAV